MRLNILTAVSRPENLGFIADSLSAAAMRGPGVRVCWRWRFDLGRRNVGGQAIKNQLIEEVPDGEWLWVLDDDTLAHEDVLMTLQSFGDYDAVVFSQQRTDGRVLTARPENVMVGSIDIGQAFIKRSLVGDHRIPEDYNGDGMFLSAVLDGAVLYHPAALSLHNALSGVDVSV